MANFPTPHIKATPDDFAKTVLMPGDPLRSRHIAQNYLQDAHLVNDVRGIQGYTGTWQGVPVSVMASGMGMPSMGIYSYELFTTFEVENIIRIGSCGSFRDDVNVRDIVIAQGASTDSNFAKQYGLPGSFAPLADYGLICAAVEQCKKLDVPYHVGNVLSSDIFYNANQNANRLWADMGLLCVEMEAAALYCNAAKTGGKALGIFTVSDNVFTGESLSSDDRQSSFGQMMEVALGVAISN